MPSSHGSRMKAIVGSVLRVALVLGVATSLAGACGGAPDVAAPTSPIAAPADTSSGKPTAGSSAAEAPVEMAPPPYTAEQIREATRAGRTLVFAITAEGAPAKRRTTRFVAVDPDGAQIETETADADGKNAVTGPLERATWEDLRKHAEFPRAAVTVTEARVKVKAGEFDCAVYTVKDDRGVTTLHFAKELPGPPVLFVTERDGKVVSRSELVEHRAGGATPTGPRSTALLVEARTAMKMDGQIAEQALLRALQPQLQPLDRCVMVLRETDKGTGSLNLQLTVAEGGAVTVALQSPASDAAKACFEGVFRTWTVTGAGTGRAMLLLDLVDAR